MTSAHFKYSHMIALCEKQTVIVIVIIQITCVCIYTRDPMMFDAIYVQAFNYIITVLEYNIKMIINVAF